MGTRQKCNILLHLGNFIAFFIDKQKSLAYDFFTPILHSD